MKGLVFNLLADLVRRDHGEDTWDALEKEVQRLEPALLGLLHHATP